VNSVWFLEEIRKKKEGESWGGNYFRISDPLPITSSANHAIHMILLGSKNFQYNKKIIL